MGEAGSPAKAGDPALGRPGAQCHAAAGRSKLSARAANNKKRMRNPLTPLQFARRARRLYPEREAVVDGALRLTYRQFLERCDRWSAVLQGWGVGAGERVLVVAPNTHAMLEQFYAVPQLGAIIVPVNYRLSVEDFRYLFEHSEPLVVCAHRDYLGALGPLRAQLPSVRHFVALEGAAPGWEDYEALLAAAPTDFVPAPIAEVVHPDGAASRSSL